MKIDSIIEDILHGKRGHNNLVCSKRCKQLSEIVCENEAKLLKEIENKKDIYLLFESYNSSIANLHCQEVDDYYVEGFKIGVLLGMELLSDG